MIAELQAALAEIQARINAAALRAKRDPAEITLIAVTKTHPAATVAAALECGIVDCGENRVQEATTKREELAEQPRWHLIGHLQRNKARRAVEIFALIHSVDSLRLAQTLDRLAEELGRAPLPVLLQLNVSGEASKEGFQLSGGVASPAWAQVREELLACAALPNLDVRGLMTIAPYSEDLEGVVRPCFRALREVRDALRAEDPHHSWDELSMGMSGDFEIAIEEGATYVRVGTALFGSRDYP